MEQRWWNSDSGTVLWNSEPVIVEQCGGTVEQCWWNSVVEQCKSNKGTVWWNSGTVKR